MAEPTGLAGWAVGRPLDEVIGYVVEANDCFRQCEELKKLLNSSKPMIAEAISGISASGSSRPEAPAHRIEAVKNWLRELEQLLQEAADMLQKALAWAARHKQQSGLGRQLELGEKKKWSSDIRTIIQRFRTTTADGVGYAMLAMQMTLHKDMEEMTLCFRRGPEGVPGQHRISSLNGGMATTQVAAEWVEKLVDEAFVRIKAAVEQEMEQVKQTVRDSQVRQTLRRLESRRRGQAEEDEFGSGSSHSVALTHPVALTMHLVDIGGTAVRPVVKFSHKVIKTVTENFAHKLGEDRFQCVFKGQLEAYGMVAVKVYRRETGMQDMEQGMQEMEHLAACGHENIIKMYGYCIAGKRNWKNSLAPWRKNLRDLSDKPGRRDLMLVLEYAESGSLHDHLYEKVPGAPGPVLEWSRRFSIIVGVAKALVHLHEFEPPLAMVHRDVKPANILLDKDMRPKLGDFGLSVLADGGHVALMLHRDPPLFTGENAFLDSKLVGTQYSKEEVSRVFRVAYKSVCHAYERSKADNAASPYDAPGSLHTGSASYRSHLALQFQYPGPKPQPCLKPEAHFPQPQPKPKLSSSGQGTSTTCSTTFKQDGA